MFRAGRVALLLFGPFIVAGFACAALFQHDDVSYGPDSGAPIGDEARGDAGDTTGSGDVEVAYHDWQQSGFWETFDLRGAGINAGDLSSAVFDGKNLYIATFRGPFVRYRTGGNFKEKESWSSFDLQHLGADFQSSDFFGGGLLGPYAYFAPNDSPPAPFARFEIGKELQDRTAWQSFLPATLDAGLGAFAGVVVEGDDIYFVPHANVAGQVGGTIARYRHPQAFDAAASWETYNLAGLRPGATGFVGGVVVDTQLFLVPNHVYGTVIAKRVRAPRLSEGWEFFDVSGLAEAPIWRFFGAVTDGRYVYFGPSGEESGVYMGRYDTTRPFDGGIDPDGGASWTFAKFSDIEGRAKKSIGAAFDGRYVYIIPQDHEYATRFDTHASLPLGDRRAWTTLNLRTIDPKLGPNLGPFGNAGFDGRYLYFLSQNGIVARFDARTPASAFRGSFL